MAVFEYFADIIRAAGAGPLSFAALVALLLTYIATKFFSGSPLWVRIVIFLLLFLGAVALIPLFIHIDGEDGEPLAYGGAYEAEGNACLTVNPVTGGCTCPNDFSKLVMDDLNLVFCHAEPAVTKNRAALGGGYEKFGYDCLMPNPLTRECSCPLGFEDVGYRGDTVHICSSPIAEVGDGERLFFGGAFDNYDTQCVAGNPAHNGACGCPEGFQGLDYSRTGFKICQATP